MLGIPDKESEQFEVDSLRREKVISGSANYCPFSAQVCGVG